MKIKTLFSILCIPVIALSLVGCGSNKPKTTSKPIETTAGHVHSFGEWKEAVRPTCSEEGLKKRSCSCGEVEYEIIPTVDHKYVDDKCSVCHYEHLTDGFGIYYSPVDELYHIESYTGTSTTVRIPYLYNDEINGDHKICIDKKVINYVSQSMLKDANIKKLIVGSRYQNIPDNMFLGLDNLEEVVFDGSIKKVGDNAFCNCPKLKTITFNEDLEQIGFYSFANCGFESIRLPYSLKILDTGAFSGNTNLSELTYYNNLTEIRDNALNNTAFETIKISKSIAYFGFQGSLPNIKNFNVDVRNAKYKYEDNALIDTETNTLVKATSNILIPLTIENLGPYALAYLDYSDVDNFIIPSNIKNIEFNCFIDTKFKNLTISSGVATIGEGAFYNVIIEEYEDLEIELPDTLLSIGPIAFSMFKCKSITIPNSVTELGYYVFRDSLIESITVYESTLESSYSDVYWDYGIDLDYTTITIIDDIDD